jgi:hypothetical protein
VNIFTKLRLLKRILDHWAKIEKIWNAPSKAGRESGNGMKFSWNALIGTLMTVGNLAASVNEMFPPKVQYYLWGTQVVIGGVLKIIAAFRNPDGTPAAMAYGPIDFSKLK